MSSNSFSKQNSPPVRTRRTGVRNEDIENDIQHTGRRSLSEKFRNLFRKNSPSPSRTTNTDSNQQISQQRQKSSSPATTRTPTDGPHLRAPIISWPFGKKKAKSRSNTDTVKNSKTKSKEIRKNQRPFDDAIEISNPIYQEHSTSVHGQDLVPRTPEYSNVNVEKVQSSFNHENTAKGFRDYMVIDHTAGSYEVRLFIDFVNLLFYALRLSSILVNNTVSQQELFAQLMLNVSYLSRTFGSMKLIFCYDIFSNTRLLSKTNRNKEHD